MKTILNISTILVLIVLFASCKEKIEEPNTNFSVYELDTSTGLYEKLDYNNAYKTYPNSQLEIRLEDKMGAEFYVMFTGQKNSNYLIDSSSVRNNGYQFDDDGFLVQYVDGNPQTFFQYDSGSYTMTLLATNAGDKGKELKRKTESRTIIVE